MKLRHFPFLFKKWRWRSRENFKFLHHNSSTSLCLWTTSLLFLLTLVIKQSWAELVIAEAELERPPSKKSSEEYSHARESRLAVRNSDSDSGPKSDSDSENTRMVRQEHPIKQRLFAEEMNLLSQRQFDLGGDPPNVAHGPFSPDTCCVTSGETCQQLCVPNASDENCGCVYKQRWGYCQWRCQDMVGGDPNDIALDEDADPILDAVTDSPGSGGQRPPQPGDSGEDDEKSAGAAAPLLRIVFGNHRFQGRGLGHGQITSSGSGSGHHKKHEYDDILESPSKSSRRKSRKRGRSFNRNRGIYSKGAVHSGRDSDPEPKPARSPFRRFKSSKKTSFRATFDDLLK